jgi:hypothetical protein
MNVVDLSDASIPDTLKCADVVRKDNGIMMVDGPISGACVEGICRYFLSESVTRLPLLFLKQFRSCDPFSNGSPPFDGVAICTNGRVSARGCAIPGKVTKLNGMRWVSGTYESYTMLIRECMRACVWAFAVMDLREACSQHVYFKVFSSGAYYQDPSLVWQAIFFPFLIIIVVTQCLILWKSKISEIRLPFARFRSGSNGGYESFTSRVSEQGQ